MSPQRAKSTVETGSPRAGYGNVALFVTLRNHCGLRGLRGGGRSPAKLVCERLISDNREFIANEAKKQELLIALMMLKLTISLQFQWDRTRIGRFPVPSENRRVLVRYQAQ
jgi:hypothetical protein